MGGLRLGASVALVKPAVRRSGWVGGVVWRCTVTVACPVAIAMQSWQAVQPWNSEAGALSPASGVWSCMGQSSGMPEVPVPVE